MDLKRKAENMALVMMPNKKAKGEVQISQVESALQVMGVSSQFQIFISFIN